jgi:hypothetical protein
MRQGALIRLLLLNKRVGNAFGPVHGTDQHDGGTAAYDETELSTVVGQLERVIRICLNERENGSGSVEW